MLGAIGTIIGLVALVVGIPPFIQMMWGRPKITTDFSFFDEEGSRLLICKIRNARIKNKILRVIRVKRDSVDIDVFVSVRKNDSKKFLLEDSRATIALGHNLPAIRQNLTSSFSAIVSIALYNREGGAIMSPGSNDDFDLIEVAPGEYVADIKITAADNHFWEIRKFVIGESAEKTFWLS
jgi:hypothetical protein